MVNRTVLTSTAAGWPRSKARTVKAPAATAWPWPGAVMLPR
jgi:hypothetical protein